MLRPRIAAHQEAALLQKTEHPQIFHPVIITVQTVSSIMRAKAVIMMTVDSIMTVGADIILQTVLIMMDRVATGMAMAITAQAQEAVLPAVHQVEVHQVEVHQEVIRQEEVLPAADPPMVSISMTEAVQADHQAAILQHTMTAT